MLLGSAAVERLAALRRFASGRSRFRRNFLSVARANLLAQVILLVAAPILTRLFAPEAFGLAAYFTTALQLLATFCTARYEWSMPNTRNRQSAAALFVASLFAIALTVSLTLLVCLRPPALLTAWQGWRDLGALVYLLPFALIGVGVSQVFQGWFVREGDLTAVSRMKIAQSVGNAGGGVTLGLLGTGALGLILATAGSAWLGITTLALHARRLLGPLRRLRPRRVLVLARRYLPDALLSSSVSLLNVLSVTAPIVLLAQHYSTLEIGWYAMMLRLVTTPTVVLSMALAQSFWSRSAELARTRRYDELWRLYRRVTALLAVCGIGLLGACALGPWVVGPIFGERWYGAGEVLRNLSPMLFGLLVFSPTNHLIVFRKQRLQFLADGARLLSMVAMIAIASKLDWRFAHAVLALSLCSLAGHLTLFAIHLGVYRTRRGTAALGSS